MMKRIFYFAALSLAALCMCSCKSDEKGEVLAVRLDETAIEIVKGQTYQLNATVVPADEDAQITWFSEDEAYVTVDQNGLVTAVALKKDEVSSGDVDDENPSAVSVYAQYEGGAAECEVTVLPLEASAIKVSPSQASMSLGEQMMFTVEYEPEDVDVKGVEWSTTNAFVAVVKDGVVTVKGYGTCEIVAKYGRLESRAYILVL